MGNPVFLLDKDPAEPISLQSARFWLTLAEPTDPTGSRLPQKLYRRTDGSLLMFLPGRAPVELDTPELFQAAVHNFCRLQQSRPGRPNQPPIFVEGMLPLPEARVFFHAASRACLPEINFITEAPLVSLNGLEQVPEVSTPGYNPTTKVYYYTSSPILPREGVHHLTEFVSGLPFAATIDRAHLLSWLLGSVVFGNNFQHPLLTINGNVPGLGKTVTASAISLLLTGSEVAMLPTHRTEFIKCFGSHIRLGQRLFLMDNITARNGEEEFQSDDLASFITAPVARVRLLGHSSLLECRNPLFMLTTNGCSLVEDLADRSLLVDYYAEKPGPISPFVLSYAAQFRKEIYGELLGLALSLPDDIMLPVSSFRFRPWLQFVRGRILAAFNLLVNPSSGKRLDPMVRELVYWASELAAPHEATTGAFVSSILDTQNNYSALRRQLLSKKTKPGAARWAAAFLKRLCNGPFKIPDCPEIQVSIAQGYAHNSPLTFHFARKES